MEVEILPICVKNCKDNSSAILFDLSRLCRNAWRFYFTIKVETQIWIMRKVFNQTNIAIKLQTHDYNLVGDPDGITLLVYVFRKLTRETSEFNFVVIN